MSLYELEISWAETADEQRALRWELMACDEVLGVFPTARGEALAVLFAGHQRAFRDWASTVRPEVAA